MQTFSVGQSALGSQEARTAAPPPHPVTAERLHYLDPMRGLLMMLGVVLHTASVFSLSGTWVVWDRENASGWMTQLGEFIHVFRMPAFFVVSGLLFARSVRSRGVGQVLRARLVRIGVPLIVVMLTVNTSERLLVLQASGSDLSAEEFLLNELVSGHWLGHLWFLFVLLGLMTTAALGNRALVRVAKSLPTRTGILLPVLAPGLVVGIHAAAKIIEPLNWLFMSITPATWLVSFTFFASGCVMGHRDDILQGFARLQAPLVALPIYALAWAASPNRVLEVYSATVLSWIGVTVCFIVFASLFIGRPSER
ncbi:MAG TPA: acyltransferase family protein, partial [Bryobacteraceae bacterium]|nr:acyltransferase family protein [Bryobacteraceae bacterium]